MATSDQIIASTLAGDPEMLQIIELFVEQMPSRAEALQAAWQQRDRDGLVRCAHQLKGASAGYGYAPLGAAAGALERALSDMDGTLDESIHDQVESLIDLCLRVVVSDGPR